MERIIVLSSMLALLVACSPNGFQTPIPLASMKDEPATTTYSPPEPTYRTIKGKKVYDGLTKPKDFKFDLDSKSSKAVLKGTMTLHPVNEAPIEVPIEVGGVLDKDTRSGIMSVTNPDALKSLGVSGGASLTCIDASCTQLFIDVYVRRAELVYHHQLQVSGKNLDLNNGAIIDIDSSGDAVETDETPVNDKETPKVKVTPTPKVTIPYRPGFGPDSETEDQDDGSKYEHDIVDDSEAGTYVGTPEEDIEAIFPDLSGPKDEPTSDNKKDTKKDSKNNNQKDEKKKDDKDSDDSVATGAMNTVKTVLKGLGQAVTGVGKNNYTKGRLENAANIYEYQTKHKNVGFQIYRPYRKAHFGTDDMKNVLVAMGQYNNKYLNGYTAVIGDISYQKGGQLGRHLSHQMGLDADIAYYFDERDKQKGGLVDAVGTKKPIKSFMAEEQWSMFKSMVAQGNVDRIFIHPVLKKELCNIALRSGELKKGSNEGASFETLRVLRPESNHDDHFHLRLKCSKAQPRCRQMAPPAKATGC